MAIIMSPEDISKEACGQPREPGILFWNQAENWKEFICTTQMILSVSLCSWI